MRKLAFCLLAVACSPAAFAQEFEAVSIKPNDSGSGSSHTSSNQGRLTATNVSLRSLILQAFGLGDYQLTGPDWLSTQRFDMSAKFPEAFSGDKYQPALQSMLQKMLATRFNLVTHHDQKTLPVYGLATGRNGIKFKETADTGSHNSNSDNRHYTGACVTMDAFADFLERRKSDLPEPLPVLNMTDLKGCYTLSIEWVPELRQPEATAGAAPPAEPVSGVTLMVAVQEQLGLKLEVRKAPVDIVVVDTVSKLPTEN